MSSKYAVIRYSLPSFSPEPLIKWISSLCLKQNSDFTLHFKSTEDTLEILQNLLHTYGSFIFASKSLCFFFFFSLWKAKSEEFR